MKSRTMSFALLVFPVTCLVIGATLLYRNSLASSRSALRSDVPVTQSLTTIADSAVEVEVLRLDRRGFEPAEIRRPMGRFMLAITNRSEEQQLSLEINRVAGQRIRAVDMTRGQARSLENLDLPSGEYLLSETNHPRWKCRIVISPR